MARTLRLAVAQSRVAEDPHDIGDVHAATAAVRALMRRAHAEGARLVQFPEGAVVYPSKYSVSSAGPEVVADADWSDVDWYSLEAEAESIRRLAAELRLWTVFGSIRPLSAPNRPTNSLYIVSDTGRVVARYDKRFLSNTEYSHLYTRGSAPTVFEVDGIRFGAALCVEAHFPELFAEYERLDVDCVLLSVMVDDPMRAVIAQSYAALFDYWVGYSVPAQFGAAAPAGVVAPGGRWLARCAAEDRADVVVADIDLDSTDDDVVIARRYARPWRRAARTLYAHAPELHDPRAAQGSTF